ncbi:MAG: flippase-like domain-containing protein [Prevotellaceae bacterium]|nr:flippase-like domain-containing protein [Prevotellaceae bacterium]
MRKITTSADRNISPANIIYFLIFMMLGVLALWYCFKSINFDEFMENMKSVNYLYIGLSILFGFIAFIIRALRWNILINTLGHRPGVYDTYNAVVTGYIANLAIPRIGEIARCATLYRTNRIPVNSLFGTVVTERIIDMLSLFVIMILVFFVKMDLFSTFVRERILLPWKPMFESLSLAWILLIVTAAVIMAIAAWIIFRRILRKPSMHRFRTMLTGLADGLKSVLRMKKKLGFIAYTVAIWLCYWLTSYLVMKALPLTSALTAADGLLLMVLGSLGWIVPVPGGFGTFHTLIAWGLMMYGIDFDSGVIFATLSHESQLLVMLFFGLIALVSVSLTKNKMNQKC